MDKMDVRGFILHPLDGSPNLAGKWLRAQPLMFLGQFVALLVEQLESDQRRHGNKWRDLPLKGGEDRIFDRLGDYYSDYLRNGTSPPWLKIAGLALIGWIRENYPELCT